MLKDVFLYCNTLKYLKISQILYRMNQKLGLQCSLGHTPDVLKEVNIIKSIEVLDYDSVFLERYNANEILNNNLTLLNSTSQFDWTGKWYVPDKSLLWNFNLHYFEYLFCLFDAYKKTNDYIYLKKALSIIINWIKYNKRGDGIGWDSYTISLRLANWLAFYSYISNFVDDEFNEVFIKSLYEQFVYLSTHLEKHLLGNHYFENLKAIVLSSIFFKDDTMLNVAFKELLKECKEQILSDGMHFELSPMYHKIILEDLIRIAVALKYADKDYSLLNKYIQDMADVAYTFENGLSRIPLFNDCGNNVAKSLKSITFACDHEFGIIPKYKHELSNSGYYFFRKEGWTIIVDAGPVGPDYIPGHAHCDSMSFEIFYNGFPVIVNCGTYAYQCIERNYYRSTRAHNTVQFHEIEQSEIWKEFRVAKRSHTTVLSRGKNHLKILMEDQLKNRIVREFLITNEGVRVIDKCSSGKIQAFVHFNSNIFGIVRKGKFDFQEAFYSEEFGKQKKIMSICYYGDKEIEYFYPFLENDR